MRPCCGWSPDSWDCTIRGRECLTLAALWTARALHPGLSIPVLLIVKNKSVSLLLFMRQSCFCSNLEPNAFLTYMSATLQYWMISILMPQSETKQQEKSTGIHTLNASPFMVIRLFLTYARSEPRVLGLLFPPWVLIQLGFQKKRIWWAESLHLQNCSSLLHAEVKICL